MDSIQGCNTFLSLLHFHQIPDVAIVEHMYISISCAVVENRICAPVQASMSSAIEAARRELQAVEGRGIICVTGSLHAVAEALSSVDLQAQA